MEPDLHHVVAFSQLVLDAILYDSAPECAAAMCKHRVDEGSITIVPSLIQNHLSGQEAADATRALRFLKQAVDEICLLHHKYAIFRGTGHGKKYNIPVQDVMSLAPEGLYKAAMRFVPMEDSTPQSRKMSFMAYLNAWVRQTIQTSISRKLTLSLDAALYEDSPGASMIDQITEADTLWGGSQSVQGDTEELEELRLMYCPHLTIDEMTSILYDPDKGAVLMRQLGLVDAASA